MSNQFFTEFPLHPEFGKDEFFSSVLLWISGIQASNFNRPDLESLLTQEGKVENSLASGEAIRTTSVVKGSLEAHGVRYDLPDDSRIWRTDAVWTRSGEENYLTLRVSCLSDQFLSKIDRPRKPVIIRQLVESGRAGRDGQLLVSDSPHYLSTDEVKKGAKIVLGDASHSLPIVYVSCNDDNSLPIDSEELSFHLSGLAHTVIEPDREFSFRLRDEVDGRNAYGGAIGIAWPGQPISIRLFRRAGGRDFLNRVSEIIQDMYTGRIASHGIEWSDLQQLQLRAVRMDLSTSIKKTSENPALEEWISAFDREALEKDNAIKALKGENAALAAKLNAQAAQSRLADVLTDLRSEVGELYDGELLDRLRNAVLSGAGTSLTLSDRDRAVLAALAPMMELSKASSDLTSELRKAAKNEDTREVLEGTLSPLGYSVSYSGPHVKFTPPDGVKGLGQVTIAKTPSDHRAGKNTVSEVRRALGLSFG